MEEGNDDYDDNDSDKKIVLMGIKCVIMIRITRKQGRRRRRKEVGGAREVDGGRGDRELDGGRRRKVE